MVDEGSLLRWAALIEFTDSAAMRTLPMLPPASLREQRREEGFTLIELIVVIAIIGLLLAIAIPVYGDIQQRARKNAVLGSAKHAYNVARAFEADDNPATSANSAATLLTNSKILVQNETAGPSGSGDGICMSAAWQGGGEPVPPAYVGDCS